MPALTLSGIRCYRATVAESRFGAWRADVQLEGSTVPASGSLEVDSVATWTGVVVRGAPWLDAVHLRMLGADLARATTPAAHENAPARLVLGDLLRDAGLTQAADIAPELLAARLSFVRVSASVAESLDALARVLSATWRVTREGAIWLGTDDFPALEVEHDLTEYMPAAGRLEIASAGAELRPGVTFREHRIERVLHTFEPGRARSVGWWRT